MAEQKKTNDRKVVAPLDGTEHGYIGYAPGDSEDLTVAAQVGDTANVADQPKSEQKSTTRKTSGS